MRRLLLVLLLVFIPLQSVWAAAAAYCSHEAAPSAVHFGHHVHQHHGDDDGDKAGTSLAKTALDMDCHACHSMANALHQDASATPLWVQDMQLAPPLRFTLPTPSPQRPERPNWPPLA
ncbi:hypothetical protein [Alicycliphilus denitrificans]|uniref:hypothetical protein n=1 Tax=Alicycliphilus denitrificans TaxID=179636 RepID=UPI00385039B0